MLDRAVKALLLRAGRMLIAQGAIDASKIGVTIALRYACARPQFQDKRIMEYLTHQRRLLPALATTYAMQLQSLRLKVLLHALAWVVTCEHYAWSGNGHIFAVHLLAGLLNAGQHWTLILGAALLLVV